jgi:hypothetical protein
MNDDRSGACRICGFSLYGNEQGLCGRCSGLGHEAKLQLLQQRELIGALRDLTTILRSKGGLP